MAIKVNDLFVETKKVLESYRTQVEELNQQEQELHGELEALQHEMTMNLLEQETAGLGEKIYLKTQAKGFNSKAEVIETMLEEIQESKTALKIQYAVKVKEAINADRITKSKDNYDVTEIVNRYRYEMVKAVAEIGKEMQSQYHEVAPEVLDILEDKTVRETYPRILEQSYFNDYLYRPSYKGSFMEKEIEQAKSGFISKDIPVPTEKDVK